jgi:hypothetical protein
MSQPMNFSPDIKILEGGDIPNNSVTLVYSPSCPHCHNILPQYNQLSGLSGGKFSVNAVNLMDHYHTLRAGGVEVGGVPQILIRGGNSEILEYGGPRMAESISKEALSFISGGAKLHGGRVFGGDMLLGGHVQSALGEVDTLSGGRRRRRSRRMRGGASPSPSLEGGRRRRRRRSLRGGSRSASPSLEGGRRRRRRRSLRGGETEAEVPETTDFTGGKKRSRWLSLVMKIQRSKGVSLKSAMKKAKAIYRK